MKIVSAFLLILLIATLVGCASNPGPETINGKFERGEGDGGEGEPCITTDDCDEQGEICINGVCIYESP